MPIKDYRFEFLKILNESDTGLVDFRPILMPLIESGEIGRATLKKMFNDLKRDEFINILGDFGTLTVSQGGVYVADHMELLARLQYKGIDEYHRLQRQYGLDKLPTDNPTQIIHHYGDTINADGSSGIILSKSENVQAFQASDSSLNDITHKQTTTPPIKDSTIKRATWYKRPLFTIIIGPLLVLILFALIGYIWTHLFPGPPLKQK
jgi:hypothetical protein